MEAGGWVSQLDFDEAAESRHCRPFGDEGDNCCQSQGFQVLQIMCSAFLNYFFVIMYLVFQMTYLYLCIWNLEWWGSGPSGIPGIPGSRDFESAKIPGFLKLKSRDFSGFFVTIFWTPWNAFSPAPLFFHLFSSSIKLFIDGKRTTHKDKKINTKLINVIAWVSPKQTANEITHK